VKDCRRAEQMAGCSRLWDRGHAGTLYYC